MIILLKNIKGLNNQNTELIFPLKRIYLLLLIFDHLALDIDKC